MDTVGLHRPMSPGLPSPHHNDQMLADETTDGLTRRSKRGTNSADRQLGTVTTSSALDRSAPATGPRPVLEVTDLYVKFGLPDRQVHAVTGATFQVGAGEIFALVGESGSGKSVTALSIMGLLQPPARVEGSIRLDGRELTTLKPRQLRSVRGREIGMVFQDPMSSLNPVHTVGKQIGESLRLHLDMNRSRARSRSIDLLGQVGIPDPRNRVDDYPHEFSGGMRQRAMIAIALACDPKVLIADEPTTALDVTVQRQIVELVLDLQRDRDMSVIWITHDLGVVAEIADRVAVMYGGRIMEEGPAGEIYGHTRHPYTSGLLRSIPRIERSTGSQLAEIPGTPVTITTSPTSCVFHARCPMEADDCQTSLPELVPTDRPDHRSACLHHAELEEAGELWSDVAAGTRRVGGDDRVIVRGSGLSVHFPGRRRSHSVVRAVDGVDLEVRAGRTLGVVGESGCGKTTLGRTLVGLIKPTTGSVEIAESGGRRVIQMVFQDPFSSMNPGMRIRDVIAEPIRILSLEVSDLDARVAELLEMVGLPADAAGRHPHEFSGGQRQRIAIARALAAEPEVIVCDEPVSALDVSVQAQIINLLRDLQDGSGLAFVFIAHDLAVVRHISDEVAVMYLGLIVERATRDDLYSSPLHPYTKALLDSVPVPDPDHVRSSEPLHGDLPSPSAPPAGCRFHTRCPIAVPGMCDTDVPRLRPVAAHRWVACHLVDPDSPHIRQPQGGERQ